MGLYAERVFPRVMNALMNTEESRRIRSQASRPCRARCWRSALVPATTCPSCRRPSAGCWRSTRLSEGGRWRRLASPQHAATSTSSGWMAAASPSPTGRWTTCWPPGRCAASPTRWPPFGDPPGLRPGGAFHFVDHGPAPDEEVRRWQHRCNGLNRRIAGGCNITRDIPALIVAGGMSIQRMDTYHAKGGPQAWGGPSRGGPRRPEAAESPPTGSGIGGQGDEFRYQ